VVVIPSMRQVAPQCAPALFTDVNRPGFVALALPDQDIPAGLVHVGQVNR
jgi:hypothetical protein